MSKAESASAVKERPIIFGAWKVARILEWVFSRDGSMQTRRVRGLEKVNGDREAWRYDGMNINGDHLFYDVHAAITGHDPQDCIHIVKCPYGRPGERLWVRETWGTDFNARFHEEHGLSAPDFIVDAAGEPCVLYAADRDFPMLINEEFTAEHNHFAWKSPIHMRRAASRITLELTGVYAERVQDITEDDAKAEGCILWTGRKERTRREHYREMWDALNAKRGFDWDSNPWVWVLMFKRDAAPQPTGT